MRVAESGQVSGEYAIVIGMIAVVCIVAAVFIGFAIAGHFESDGERVRHAPLEPPRSSLAWPTSIEECEDGGWRNFAQFRDEDECIEYVESLAP
jgi:Flp pilus assembly pilin Flp